MRQAISGGSAEVTPAPMLMPRMALTGVPSNRRRTALTVLNWVTVYVSSARRRRIDVALVPVWGWGPNLGPGHLTPREAAAAGDAASRSNRLSCRTSAHSSAGSRSD